jgi:RNA polymerase sigma-70 factor (ECF subfamily)
MATADDFVTIRSLVLAVCRGTDADSWRRFFLRYQPLILSWCRGCRLQDDDAEEVFSRVLKKLLEALPGGKYDPRRPFRSWLKAVVVHAVQDWLRHRGRHPGDYGTGDSRPRVADAAAPGDPDELGALLGDSLDRDYRLAQEAVQRVQDEYPPQSQTWKVFEETMLKGRRAADVAAELGMSNAAVCMARARVIKKLQQALAGLQPPGPVCFLSPLPSGERGEEQPTGSPP